MSKKSSRTSCLIFKLALSLAIFFVALQFVRPALSNLPVTADLAAPPEVKQILKTSCYNCHSNETSLSWFDWLAPAYWIVARDVKLARHHLNFSEIGRLPSGQQQGALFESLSQIELGAMPLPNYRRLHPESALSDAQIAVLKNYLHSFTAPKITLPAEIAAADDQFNRWIAWSDAPPTVSAAPNGISFVPDYKTWRPISSTERADNHTLRLILGNSIAIHAIAASQINPWPDGTVFAKVAWLAQQQGNEPGLVRSGAFFQVEFMIKDSCKYSATRGWGWARWRGANLTPYGKDANFINECVSCHRPLAKTDYVFTFPIRPAEARQSDSSLPFNQVAALIGQLPFSALQWQPITSLVDSVTSSMSTLYGNEIAVNYARTHVEHNYPNGAILALVTWSQREDPRWYGGYIPGRVKSVEFLYLRASLDQSASSTYERYSGAPLDKEPEIPITEESQRTKFLVSLRAAVLP